MRSLCLHPSTIVSVRANQSLIDARHKSYRVQFQLHDAESMLIRTALTIACGWAGAVMQKPLVFQKWYQTTDTWTNQTKHQATDSVRYIKWRAQDSIFIDACAKDSIHYYPWNLVGWKRVKKRIFFVQSKMGTISNFVILMIAMVLASCYAIPTR